MARQGVADLGPDRSAAVRQFAIDVPAGFVSPPMPYESFVRWRGSGNDESTANKTGADAQPLA